MHAFTVAVIYVSNRRHNNTDINKNFFLFSEPELCRLLVTALHRGGAFRPQPFQLLLDRLVAAFPPTAQRRYFRYGLWFQNKNFKGTVQRDGSGRN
jgi:hypothetical protein